MKPPFKELHADALGIFLWFLRKAWNPLTRFYWRGRLRETLHRFRHYRCDAMSFFMWLSDGKGEHVLLNGRTPYKKERGRFNLNRWNNKYWKVFGMFLEDCKTSDIRPIPSVLMDRYCYGPYH